MKRKHFFIAACCIFILSLQSKAQCEGITAPQLKQKLIELGNTVKDIIITEGKEKYEVTYKTTDLNVPVGYEISTSKNFIWLTVNLGPAPANTDSLNAQLLRQNGSIQPCFFYITSKSLLMMGLGIENRGINNAILRRHSDKLIADVRSTKGFWQK